MLVAATTAAAAVVVGAVAARDPVFLHFQPSVRDTALLGAALGLGAALLWRPGAALVVLVLVVYLNLSDVLIRWHGAPSLLQALALPLALAAWVAHRRQHGPAGPPPLFLSLGLAAYPLVLWLSSLWAREPALADERAVALGKAFVIYALVLLLAGSRERLRLGVWSVVATATLVAGLGSFQALTGTYGQTFGGLARVEFAQIYGDVVEPRISGPVGDPNFFAQMLIPAVPLALYLAQGTPSVRRRVAAFGCAAVVTAAVVLTYSRGGALALGLVLALWLLSRGISGRRLALGAAVAAGLLVLVPADFTQRLTTFRQLLPGSGGQVLRLDSSFENRRVLATAAWFMFLDRPLTGVGAGNYTVHFRAYADETGSATLEYEEFDAAHYPHNLYLEVAAETGWPGLLIFGTALAAAFVVLGGARRRFRRAGDVAQAALATGVLLALVGYLVSSLFLHGHFPRYLWLLFGLAAALHRVALTAPTPLVASDQSSAGGVARDEVTP